MTASDEYVFYSTIYSNCIGIKLLKRYYSLNSTLLARNVTVEYCVYELFLNFQAYSIMQV